MAMTYNDRKMAQLGEPLGTASGRLRKQLLYATLIELGRDDCFRCGEKIGGVERLSIDHKVPWLDSGDPVRLFFEPGNIAFSHLSCNIILARKPHKYQTEELRRAAHLKAQRRRQRKHMTVERRRAKDLRHGY